MKARISFLVLTLLILAPYKPVKSQSTHRFNGYDLVDKEGNIRKPAGYRGRYELLGTYAVLDPKGNQIHVTYATLGTAAYYAKPQVS